MQWDSSRRQERITERKSTTWSEDVTSLNQTTHKCIKHSRAWRTRNAELRTPRNKLKTLRTRWRHCKQACHQLSSSCPRPLIQSWKLIAETTVLREKLTSSPMTRASFSANLLNLRTKSVVFKTNWTEQNLHFSSRRNRLTSTWIECWTQTTILKPNSTSNSSQRFKIWRPDIQKTSRW